MRRRIAVLRMDERSGKAPHGAQCRNSFKIYGFTAAGGACLPGNVRNKTGSHEAGSGHQENKNNPNKKTSGLAARLEAMQKQAEEMQKQRMNQKR